MNIFAVSRHPRKCARALDDKRLNKMILETAQILCTVLNGEAGRQVTPYRSCHVNHPATRWAAENRVHMCWLYRLGIAYGEEIQHRFGRKHACQLVIEGLTFKWPELHPDYWPKKTPPEPKYFYNGARHQSLGLDFTKLPVHKAYREYLRVRWPGDKIKPRWTNRKPPSWL